MDKEYEVVNESEEVIIPEEEEGSEEVVEKSNKPDYETLARERGWVPEADYSGDPETWVDAKEFLGRAPLYDSIHDLKRTLKKMQSSQDALRKHYEGVHEAAYKQAISDLQRQMDAAVEENDVKGVVKAQRAIEQVQTEFEKAQENMDSDLDNEPTPVFEKWVEKNQWYTRDEDLQSYADGVALRLTKKHPDKDPEELFEMVSQQVKKTFPNKFQNPAKRKPAPVEGGGRKAGGKESNLSYVSLPEEAKKIYKQLVKSKSNPHGILTPEEFFADYAEVGGPLNTEE